MSEMLKRVAEAIHEIANEGDGDGMEMFRAEMCARAAIAAMREPTQVMLAWSNPPPWDKDALEVGYREVWEGMIDTALKDKAEDQS